MHNTLVATWLGVVVWLLTGPAKAADWPQLANTPQRSNCSPERVEPPYRIRWVTRLADLSEVETTGGEAVSSLVRRD